ncbi:unnamed protein product [Owenia fusiformis]|nr:unnamed protein product [Owenia fusiformis]
MARTLLGALLVLVMFIKPSVQVIDYPVIQGVPADREICKNGYYWDEFQGDNCCSYHQCNEDHTEAYQRFCAPPLVWNRNASTCDWQDNIPYCIPENDTCWAPPEQRRQEQPECVANITMDQCCQVGEFDQVEEGKGLLFTKVNETHYIYHHDRWSQKCPDNGTFNLDTCCCDTGRHAMPSCLHWHFDLFVRDVRYNVPMAEGGCRFNRDLINEGVPKNLPGFSLECMGDGRPARLEYFSNAWWGDEFGIAIWFRCVGDCGDGVIYSNGQAATEKTAEINPTIQLTIARGGVRDGADQATFLIADRLSIKTFMKTVDLVVPLEEWNFFMFQMKGTKLWTFWGTQETHQASYDDTSLLDLDFRFVAEGNTCPLKVGDFRGTIDQLLICPFVFTNDEVGKWRQNPNLFPEPRYSFVYRQILGLAAPPSTSTTTTTTTTTRPPRRRGRKRRRAEPARKRDI